MTDKGRKLTPEEIHELAIAPLPSFIIWPKRTSAGNALHRSDGLYKEDGKDRPLEK